jgi:hypothetical protein
MFKVFPPQVVEIRQQMAGKSDFFSRAGFPDSLQRFEERRGGNNEKVETSERRRSKIKWGPASTADFGSNGFWASQISFVSTFSLFKALQPEAQCPAFRHSSASISPADGGFPKRPTEPSRLEVRGIRAQLVE